MGANFSREERVRYGRHMVLPEVGADGQAKLKEAKVLLVGLGGLGSPTAMYLAAAGVGTLGLVDFDEVDLSNIHRQVIHGTSDVGRSKLDSAAETIGELNPHVRVVKHETMLERNNAETILAPYDLVVDGTDNFSTRYLINDACVLLGKVNIYGSVLGFEGQATVLCDPRGPCYRCLYPEPPPPGLVPSCAEGGVLGVLPGLIGLIQATEAVKRIVGVGDPLVGRLLMVDALSMRFEEVRIRRDPNCPVCGENPSITELSDDKSVCGVAPSPSRVPAEIGPNELVAMRRRGERFTLLDVRTPAEWIQARIPGAVFIPLAELPERVHELHRSEVTVVYCRSGARSATACEILRSVGFDSPINLAGGIIAWDEIGGDLEA